MKLKSNKSSRAPSADSKGGGKKGGKKGDGKGKGKKSQSHSPAPQKYKFLGTIPPLICEEQLKKGECNIVGCLGPHHNEEGLKAMQAAWGNDFKLFYDSVKGDGRGKGGNKGSKGKGKGGKKGKGKGKGKKKENS